MDERGGSPGADRVRGRRLSRQDQKMDRKEGVAFSPHGPAKWRNSGIWDAISWEWDLRGSE